MSVTSLNALGWQVPSWFAPRPAQPDAPRLVVADSNGPNMQDLLAATMLALEDADFTAHVACGDDARRGATAQSVAEAAADWGAQCVVGHFGARTAVPASRVYARREVLFLAAGTSATHLCDADSSTTWQWFGRDCEQLACLAEGARDVRSIAILGQAGNYGEDLALGLRALLLREATPPSVEVRIATADLAASQFESLRSDLDLYCIFGSKEFVVRTLAVHGIASSGAPLLLPDECFGAAWLQDPPVVRRGRVAFLERCSEQLIDRPAQVVRARAARLLGRQPGAYLETSYAAVRAFAFAWQHSDARTAAALGEQLAARPWPTPFGALRFTAQRQLTGHRWLLHAAGLCEPHERANVQTRQQTGASAR